MFQVAGICIWYFNFHLHSYIRCIYIYTMHVPPTHGYIQIEILFHHHWWLSVGIVQVHYLPKIRFCFLLTFKIGKTPKKRWLNIKGFSHVFTCKNSCTYIRNMTIWVKLIESFKMGWFLYFDVQIPYLFLHFVAFFNPQTLPWSQRFFFPSQLQREAHLSTKKQHPPR